MENIIYVTTSTFKRDENTAFARVAKFSDGIPVSRLFTFEFRSVPVVETLEVDLCALVESEVKKAYQAIRIPCIVEHAGLVFDDYANKSYPGGLTKPMWNALGDRFVSETHSAGRRAVARAAIGYCDGKSVKTFLGETEGYIAPEPRGNRSFYWDTILIPDTGDPRKKRENLFRNC